MVVACQLLLKVVYSNNGRGKLTAIYSYLFFFLLSAALERTASDRQTDGFVHFVLNFLVDSDSPVTPSTKSDVYNLY